MLISKVSLNHFLKTVKPIQDLRLDTVTFSGGFLVYRSRLGVIQSETFDDRIEASVSLRSFLSAVASAKSDYIAINQDAEGLSVSHGDNRTILPVSEVFPVTHSSKGFFSSVAVRPFWTSYLGKVATENSPRSYGTVVLIDRGFTGLVATDGFRLAKVGSPTDKTFTLGVKAFNSMSALLAGDLGEASLSEDESMLKVKTTLVTALYRTSNVNYPNYKGIIPNLLNYRQIAVNRKDFLDKLKFAKNQTDKSNSVRLDFSFEGIHIYAINSTTKINNYSFVAVKDCSTLPSVTLNARFLIDALAGSKEEYAVIFVKDAELPVSLQLGNTQTILCPIKAD